ncbi:MAG TPA: carboxypeptidase regulatory-like domain-containing protein [Acidobacteriaceae bacterium]
MKHAAGALLLAMAALLPAQSALQNAPSAEPGGGTFTISGTVVSAATGAPLDRADVTLATTGANGTELAETLTGETGAFRFDGLLAGKYAVQASRRGYITASYQEHGGYFTAVVTGPGLDSQGIRLEVMPYGTIAGTISDDNGSGVGGAQVGLFREDDASGDEKIASAGQEITDDSGSYEFTHLQPGTYYLDVSATPWYAFHPPVPQDDGDPQQAASPLDVAYPLTFYPNATDSASATPIPLTAGDRAQANFSLHAVAATHLRVRTSGPRRGRPFNVPNLQEEVFGSPQFLQAPSSFTMAHNGEAYLNIAGIAPGHYTLQSFNEQGEPSGSTSIDATGNQTIDLSSVVSPGVALSGKVAMTAGGPLPPRLMAWLQPVEGVHGQFSTPVERDGTFSFASVSPGTWEVHVHAEDDASLLVVEMAATGAEVHGNRITVNTDPILLAATIGNGSATIDGYARQNGKGMGGTLVVLVPDDPNASAELCRRDQSDSDGSFSLSDVVPGSYTIVAIENGWGLEWAKRDVMARYLARGVHVQVGANQRTINLTEPAAVQER